MGNNHIITKSVGNLRGISTDSIFVRTSNIAEIADNIQRLPDDTLSTRRGYQCQIRDIGGLGDGTFDDPEQGTVELITVNDDGLIYQRLNRQIYLYYDGRITGEITNATQANPCEITTATNHGLVTGAEVTIQNITGMTELNNQTYTITVTGLTTFTLDGVDSTSFTAYSSGGEWILSFTNQRYLELVIFTDPRFLTSNPGWSIAPWSLAPWGAPSGESITCNITVFWAGKVNGNQSSVNTLVLDAGHEFAMGDVVQFYDSHGFLQQRNILSTTATSITIDGMPVSVVDNASINQYFDIPFRKGFDVVTPYLITTFISTITDPTSGVEGLLVAANGDTNYPAAFLEIMEPVIIGSGSVFTLQYYYWQAVNKTVPVTLPGSASTVFQNSPEFENATMATFDDVIYIANGIDFPQKFDGQNVYRAGMPQGDRPLLANAGAGKLSDGTYIYGLTYEQVDMLGHIAEGAISETRAIELTGGPSNVNVTVDNILANTGWNTDCAIAVGGTATVYGPDIDNYYYNLISVVNSPHTMHLFDNAFYTDTTIAVKNGLSPSAENTFTVFTGHGVEVGDRVGFLENSSNDTLLRIVTEISPTTITVDGPPVLVANNTNFYTNKVSRVYGDVAIIDGDQADVNTIVVLTGHSIQVDDYVQFTDSFGRIQRRNVTAIGATSVTIDGIPVSVSSQNLIFSLTIAGTSAQLRATSFYIRRTNANGATLAANAPISNNLRINLWRTENNGTLLKQLITIPNNSLSATQTYLDTVQAGQTTAPIIGATQANPCELTSVGHGLEDGNQISVREVMGMVELNNRRYTITVTGDDTFTLNGIDSTGYTAYTSGGTWTLIFGDNSELGFDFPDPIRRPDPPPISKYVLTFNNQLLYGGGEVNNPDNSDNVFFSEGDLPESVPSATNFFTVVTPDDDITGMGVAGTTLVVSKNNSIHAVIGDLLTSQFQVTPIAPGTNIGCVAFATMRSVGSLLYFLHSSGVYSISENQLYPTDAYGNPIALSLMIEGLFRETKFLPQTRFVFKRAVAWNYTKDYQYLLFLPAEDSLGTQRVANQNSVLLCYDYQGKNWFSWKNMNCAGGIYTIGDDLYFHERRFSGIDGNTANLYKQHRFYRLIDYADHTSPIRTEWRSSWEDLGLPEVRKKFIRSMLLMDRVSDLYQFNNPQLTFTTYLNRIPNLANTIAEVTTVNNNFNSGWSVSPWGWGIWSGYQDTFVRVNLRQGTVAKSIQLGLVLFGINATFRLAGFELEVAPDYRKTWVR